MIELKTIEILSTVESSNFIRLNWDMKKITKTIAYSYDSESIKKVWFYLYWKQDKAWEYNQIVQKTDWSLSQVWSFQDLANICFLWMNSLSALL